MKKYILFLAISFILLNLNINSQETFNLTKKNFLWKIDSENTQLPFKELSGIWKIEPVSFDENKFALTQKLNYLDFARFLSIKSYYDFTFSANIYLKSDLNKQDVKQNKKDKKDKSDDESIAAGLIFRHRNNFKYYMLFIDSTDNEIALIKNNYGKKIIKKIKTPINNNQWYTLTVKCYLDEIAVMLNNKEIFKINDSTSTGGKIGLTTYKKTVAFFNNIALDTEIITTSKENQLDIEE